MMVEVKDMTGIVVSPPTTLRIPEQQVVTSLGKRFEFNKVKKNWDACVEVAAEVRGEPHTSCVHRLSINCTTGEQNSYSQVFKRKRNDVQ